MAARASAEPPVTYDVLCQMPDDGRRYELFDGDIFVTPSPFYEHQNAVMRLIAILVAHTERQGLGLVDPDGRTLTELVRRGNAYRQRRVWTGEEEVRPALFPGLAFPLAELWE